MKNLVRIATYTPPIAAVKAEAVEPHTMLPIKIPTPGMVAQMARVIARPANVPTVAATHVAAIAETTPFSKLGPKHTVIPAIIAACIARS